MYILLIALVVLWFYSVYTFAMWRFHSNSQKGLAPVTVLHDRPTVIYLRSTAGITLALVLYIIY